jgi:hypothetical protein
LIVGSINLIVCLIDSIVGSISSIRFSIVTVGFARLVWIVASGVVKVDCYIYADVVINIMVAVSYHQYNHQGHQKQTLFSMVNCCANYLSYRGDMMPVDWVPNRVEEDLSIDVLTFNKVNKMVLITVAKACHQLFVAFVIVV